MPPTPADAPLPPAPVRRPTQPAATPRTALRRRRAEQLRWVEIIGFVAVFAALVAVLIGGVLWVRNAPRQTVIEAPQAPATVGEERTVEVRRGFRSSEDLEREQMEALERKAAEADEAEP